MVDRDELIHEVMEANDSVAAANESVTEAVRTRAHAVKLALDAGCGAQPLANALGVSRHRIYQMRDQGK